MHKTTYRKTVLESGLTIVSEHIPYVRSVSIGVWIHTGTRYETPETNGVAHFLEHMMFKSTGQRSAREIVRQIESLGGNINAFTSKEQTCFHVEMLDEHLPIAIDVLSDILFRTGFSAAEFEKERAVILDEIKALQDTPDEIIHDYFAEKLYPDHGLGYPVLGTFETVSELTPAQMISFYQQFYRSRNSVIAVSGNVKHAELVDLCATAFRFSNGSPTVAPVPPTAFNHGNYSFRRAINQAHLCLGFPGIRYQHPRKYDLLLLNTILGGGMGSRLFQNIREKHGIAYGIYSFLDFYVDSGLIAVYLGTDPKNFEKAQRLIQDELNRLVNERVTQQELADAKSHLKGNLVLGLESSVARMNRLAITEIYLNEFLPIDTIMQRVDDVTRESLRDTARQVFSDEKLLNVSLVPLNSFEIEKTYS